MVTIGLALVLHLQFVWNSSNTSLALLAPPMLFFVIFCLLKFISIFAPGVKGRKYWPLFLFFLYDPVTFLSAPNSQKLLGLGMIVFAFLSS